MELTDDDFFAMCEDPKKQIKTMEIKINNEFKELIPGLTTEELIQLEQNLIKDGCLTPLIIWNNTLIDGHNRYSLCKKNNIEFKTETLKFNNENEVKEWIIKNQFGRRNLSAYTRAELAIKLNELQLKDKAKNNQGQRNDLLATLPKGQNENNSEDLFDVIETFTPVSTRKELATLSGIGERSIDKVKAIQAKASDEVKEKLKAGTMTINSAFGQIKQKEKLEASQKLVLKNVETGIDNKVINTDAVSFLKSLDENSVSLVVTDPPFGIDYKPPRNVGNELFNDGKEETLELLESVCNELKRVCKDNSHLYFFSGYTNLHKFQEIIGKYFELDPNPIVWVKNNHTMCDFSKHYANKYELILFAKKGDKRLLNNKLSPDVLCFDKPTNKIHDCEKPVDLLKYLIENSSVEGEVVCDPFGGSLSTYRASIDVNRKCFTCEVNEDIYKKSMNNLK